MWSRSDHLFEYPHNSGSRSNKEYTAWKTIYQVVIKNYTVQLYDYLFLCASATHPCVTN